MKAKRIVRAVLSPLVSSQVYIGLGAVGFMLFTSLIFELEFSPPLAIIIFSEIFFIYSLNRLTDIEEDILDKPERMKHLKLHKYTFCTSLVMISLSLIYSFFHSIEVLLIVFVSFFIGFLYSVEMPRGLSEVVGYKRLKEVPLLKNTVVALVWALIAVSTLLYHKAPLDVLAFGIFLFLFLRIFLGAVAFDMRDIQGDKKTGVKTIPIMFGLCKTKVFLYILNISSALVIIAIAWFYGAHAMQLLPALVVVVYSFFYILRLGKAKDTHFLMDYIVDGEYVLLGLCSAAVMLI
jgi:4-hydroxybenzoate polyprenyltransferase